MRCGSKNDSHKCLRLTGKVTMNFMLLPSELYPGTNGGVYNNEGEESVRDALGLHTGASIIIKSSKL